MLGFMAVIGGMLPLDYSKSGFFGSASSILALGTTHASEYYSQINYAVRHILQQADIYYFARNVDDVNSFPE